MPQKASGLGLGIKENYKPKPKPAPIKLGECEHCHADLMSEELVWWMYPNRYYCWPCHEANPTPGVMDMIDLNLDGLSEEIP